MLATCQIMPRPRCTEGTKLTADSIPHRLEPYCLHMSNDLLVKSFFICILRPLWLEVISKMNEVHQFQALTQLNSVVDFIELASLRACWKVLKIETGRMEGTVIVVGYSAMSYLQLDTALIF